MLERFLTKTQFSDYEDFMNNFHLQVPEHFNFGYDVIDAYAEEDPEKEANDRGDVKHLNYREFKELSDRCASYLLTLGIERGDRVMLILKRHWQFWYAILGLHKIGAVAIPATNQLKEHDLTFRFTKGDISGIICTADGDIADQVDSALEKYDGMKVKILAGGSREGWRSFDDDFEMYSTHFDRKPDTPKGNDTMLMLFTSGTTGYPRLVSHSYKYALGHYMTARYWHSVDPEGMHFTISETGWGKALWGKLYGQWMCGAATFVYDFDRFHADDILPMFAKYQITTFCAPPTMLRLMV